MTYVPRGTPREHNNGSENRMATREMSLERRSNSELESSKRVVATDTEVVLRSVLYSRIMRRSFISGHNRTKVHAKVVPSTISVGNSREGIRPNRSPSAV